ncbi:MAG: sortase, partial [Anaerolineae bacterium]
VTLLPDGHAGPFYRLKALNPGDTVVLYGPDGAYTYQVDYLETVAPATVEVTYPSPEPRLTLITCLNYDRAVGRYKDRLVVVAHLVEGSR